MNIKDKIKELKPHDLNCNVFDVYSYNGLSMQDLLCQFFHKINECIDTSNKTIDLAEWLVNEGLKQEVIEKLMLWYSDGTLEELINVTLFENLNNKIDETILQLNQINEKSYVYIDDYLNDNNNFNVAFDLAKIEAIEKRVPIVLGKKTYLFDRPLLIENGLEIIGCDNENTVLQYTGTGTAITQTSEDTINSNIYSNVTNSSFKRFRLKGELKEGTVGIHLVNGTNITWDNIIVEGFDKNIILGFKNQQKYILFSRFNFDSIHFRTTGLELLDVQDCHFDRILVSGHANLYGEIGIRYGNNTDYGAACEGLNCVFTSPVVQYVNTGFYLDGGLGFTVNGGHAEGINNLVNQTMYADYGTYFNNFMLSGTVKDFGKMNANGIRFTDSVGSDNYLDKRLVCNDTVSLTKGDNDIHRYGFTLNNNKSRIRKLRFLYSYSTTDGSNADISVRVIEMKNWRTVGDFKLTGTSGNLISNWFSVANYLNYNDQDVRFYFTLNTPNNVDLKVNYIDLQCF